jgi:hypothetical protein
VLNCCNPTSKLANVVPTAGNITDQSQPQPTPGMFTLATNTIKDKMVILIKIYKK